MNREYRDIFVGVIVFVVVAGFLGGFTELTLPKMVIASAVSIAFAFIFDRIMEGNK